MIIEKAKQIYHIDEISAQNRASLAFTNLIKSNSSCNKKCIIMLGYSNSCADSFTQSLMQNRQMTIFVSRKKAEEMHPFYMSVFGKYPNDASSILYEGTSRILANILLYLSEANVDFVYQDGIWESSFVIDYIKHLYAMGYDIELIINKRKIFMDYLLSLEKLIVDMVFDDEKKASVTKVNLDFWVNMKRKGYIRKIKVLDSYINYSTDEEGCHMELNPTLDYTDEVVFDYINKIYNLLGRFHRFFTQEQYNSLVSLLESFKNDFYNQTSFAFLNSDGQAR